MTGVKNIISQRRALLYLIEAVHLDQGSLFATSALGEKSRDRVGVVQVDHTVDRASHHLPVMLQDWHSAVRVGVQEPVRLVCQTYVHHLVPAYRCTKA